MHDRAFARAAVLTYSPPADLHEQVQRALAEDIGAKDLTAELISPERVGFARVITRQAAVICGAPWADECFRAVDSRIVVEWRVREGQAVEPNQALFDVEGPARALLSAERAALNFLQTLSATATAAHAFASAVAGTDCKILDTRKTLPGLRTAQKYAARVGGVMNHRMGLYDAVLIKENHIAAAGGIRAAALHAKQLHPAVKIEIEVETLDQLREALAMPIDFVLLDNFSIERLSAAVEINRAAGRPVKLEASGGITLGNVRSIAETGVDYASVGSITKDIKAVDLSMRFEWR